MGEMSSVVRHLGLRTRRKMTLRRLGRLMPTLLRTWRWRFLRRDPTLLLESAHDPAWNPCCSSCINAITICNLYSPPYLFTLYLWSNDSVNILGTERADELASILFIRAYEPIYGASYRLVPTFYGMWGKRGPKRDESPPSINQLKEMKSTQESGRWNSPEKCPRGCSAGPE